MKLNSGTCDQSNNIQSPSLFQCEDFTSGVPDEGTVWVQARNLNDAGIIYFNGPVNVGNMYTLDATSDPLGADTEILVTTNALPGGTTLQRVNFHTSCSRNLFLKDRYGNSQVVEWENPRQGVVSCFREVTWTFSVFNSDTVNVNPTSLIITINDQEKISGTNPNPIPPGEWRNGTFMLDLDLSSRKTYNVKAQITADDPDRECARCAGGRELSLDIGNPFPPGVPTAAPVNLPSFTPAPSMAAGACSVVPQISCKLLNGADCALAGLALVPAQQRTCDAGDPNGLLSLGWFYRGTSCTGGTTTQDIECMDFDGGPSSGVNMTAHITASGPTGILYLSEAVEPDTFVLMSNILIIPQPLDPTIVVTIRRGDVSGQVLQNFTMQTECNAVNDITLGKTFGSLELARYRRNDRVVDSFIEVEWGFSVINAGTNNAELIEGLAQVNGVSLPSIPDPGPILAPQERFTRYNRYLILLLEPSMVKGTYVGVKAQGVPGQVDCDADADPYTFSIN